MEEQPDDRADRLVAERKAEEHVDAFVAERTAGIRALLRTYSDRDAIALFKRLREEFWESLPEETS